MSRKQRVHEWAWPAGSRTVCGITSPNVLSSHVVYDLGGEPVEERCSSCMRMRGAIGTSSKEDA